MIFYLLVTFGGFYLTYFPDIKLRMLRTRVPTDFWEIHTQVKNIFRLMMHWRHES